MRFQLEPVYAHLLTSFVGFASKMISLSAPPLPRASGLFRAHHLPPSDCRINNVPAIQRRNSAAD